jgi:predicted transcriptional regulator
MKRPVIATFKPHNTGLATFFGSLEAGIITRIWERGEASARDIFEDLRDGGHRISYGAVKTVLDRLVKKQVLGRTLQGNQFQYQALLNRQEFTRSAVREIIDSLFASFPDPVYAQFLDHVRKEEPEQLEHLIEMINQAEARRHDGDA